MLCSYFNLDWFPNTYPDETGKRELIVVGTSDLEEDGQEGGAQQIVDEVPFIGAAVPGLFPRGNVSAPFSWTELREFTDPGEQLAEGLAESALFDTSKGWVQVTIPSVNRIFVYAPAVMEATAWRTHPKRGVLVRTWTVRSGPPSEIPATIPDYAITDEVGYPITFEDGNYLVGENAP